MPEIEVVGRKEAPPTFEPIIVPVAAYDILGQETVESFAFRPVMPAGAVITAFRAIQPNGVLASGRVMEFLDKSLLNDLERKRFQEFLDRDDLMIDADLIVEVYQAVTEEWTARPTRPRSGSGSGGSPTKRTSSGRRRSAASA